MRGATMFILLVASALTGWFGLKSDANASDAMMARELAWVGERLETRPEVFDNIGVATGGRDVSVRLIRWTNGQYIRLYGRLLEPPNDYFLIRMAAAPDIRASVDAVRIDSALRPIGQAAQSVKGMWRKLLPEESRAFASQEARQWIERLGDLSNALSSAERRRLVSDLSSRPLKADMSPALGSALGIGSGADPLRSIQLRGALHPTLLYFGKFDARPTEYFFGLVEDPKSSGSWAGIVRVDPDFGPISQGAENVERKWRSLPANQSTLILGSMMRGWKTVLNR